MPDLKTLLQLGRVPNVFTAVSNVLAAYLITHIDLSDWQAAALLASASVLLYTAGMVLNDVFDVAQDCAERPTRPIPSGRISLAAARQIGFALLAAGVALGWLVTVLRGPLTPGLVATLLAVCIVAYDGVLKQTPLAPFVMGACRMLNVLLGLSLAAIGPLQWHPMHWFVAGGVGVYVTGITLFARTEAHERSGVGHLLGGLIVMLAGIAMLGYFPRLATPELSAASYPAPALKLGEIWFFLWLLFAFFLVRRSLPAVADSSPLMVQLAVKQSIFAIVIFDAAICTAVRPPVPYAAAIALLVVPMFLLGRWVYST